MVVKIGGKRMWLWRAVDDEGEVLDMLVQKRRNTDAALRLLRKLLKHQGSHPEIFVTDGLPCPFRKLNPSILMVQATEHGMLDDAAVTRNHTVYRRVLS